MNPLLSEALASALRSILKIGAGYLVARGVWTEHAAAEYVAAAALAIVGFGWSYWKTWSSRTKLVTAMAMTPGVTENDVKAAIADPKVVTPPASLPADTVPPPLRTLPSGEVPK